MSPRPKNKNALIICVQEVAEDGSSMDLGNQVTGSDVNKLHQAFIADSISNALSLQRTDVKLYFSPIPETEQSIETIVGYLKTKFKGRKRALLDSDRFEAAQLNPGRWGLKMDEAFRRCFDNGYQRVLFIGSRTPTLTHDMLARAATVLAKKDVVIGPTVEGRYYLIGFSGGYRVPLAQFDWKQPNIYSQVSSSIDDLGLSWEEIELWYAVEHPEDVEYLARDINHFRMIGDEETARETEVALERLLNRFN